MIWSNPTETTTSQDTTTRFALVLLVVFAVVVAVDVAIVPVLVVPAIFWSRLSTCSIARVVLAAWRVGSMPWVDTNQLALQRSVRGLVVMIVLAK